MKLAKKIISVICALSMVATTMVLAATDIDTAPTLVVKQTSYDSSTKTGVMTISLKGLNETAEYKGAANSKMYGLGSFQFALFLDPEKFDTSLYDFNWDSFSSNLDVNLTMNSKITSINACTTNAAAGDDGIWRISANWLAPDHSKDIAESSGWDLTEVQLATLKFKLLGDSANVSVDEILFEGGVRTTASQLKKYETAISYVLGKNGTYNIKTSIDTFGNTATPTPTATATPTPTPTVAPTPTPTAEPTATPVPTFDSGVSVFNEENDAAAWAWKTAPTEGSKVAVTLKVNGEEQVPKTFALKAAVEGTTKVGVIVQYNPTQFQTVEIVNIDFE